jgi:hypothetical protein
MSRAQTVSAVVQSLDPAGIIVDLEDGTELGLLCAVLEGSVTPISYSIGDGVLVWREPDRSRSIVLGRFRNATLGAADTTAPSEIVIEASQTLVLRVGDGSITIRKDGKILIKGKDLVSHAQRVNRIKGGSVAIN